MVEEKNSNPILNYMDSTLPPRNWLRLMLLISSGAVILFWGVGHGNDLFYTFAFGSHQPELFKIDPTLSEYIPNKIPLFFKIFSSIYEIPFYHLLFGILFKGLILVTYFFLAWKITRSTFASIFAVFMIFGLFKFEIGAETILNLKLPFVPDDMEFRRFLYLSFRQASAPFIILGTLFFLSRSFILSSIFLAFGVYCHPHIGMIFFISFNLSFLLCLFFWRDKFAVLGSWVKFILPFIIVISPYLISALSTFRDVNPMPFDLFWELNLKNEPGDASMIHNLRHNHPPYYLSFILTLVALSLHFLFRSKIPKIKFNIKNLIQEDRNDLLWAMLLAPWFLVAFGYIWESGLMIYLPDFINDLISSLHIRRANNVSTILYMPIYSVLLTKIILVLSEKLSWEVLGNQVLSQLKIWLEKINLKSIDHTFAVGLSIITLLLVLLVKSKNIESFKEFWVFDPVGYELSAPKKTSLFQFEDREIKVSSFLDICNWVQKNTPVKAAFFNPAYLRPFRTCTKRQAFVEEKIDGNYSIVDRRFATIFHRRMADIHQGLSYNDFPGHPIDSLELLLAMRQRYLSINEDIIEGLKETYPGYNYFFTEKGHELSYPVLYQNLHFIIYDLGFEQSKTN